MHSRSFSRHGIAGVIFDLDGVLMQSGPAHARAFIQVLADYGIGEFTYDRFAGQRTLDVFREVFAKRGIAVSDDEVAACSRRKSELARGWMSAAMPITEDCVSVIGELSGRYRLALASSGSRRSVDVFLDATGLHGAFLSVLSGDDVCFAKPDPELFSRSIEALHARPHECAVVEDAEAGIAAARNAGARVIGFTQDRVEALTAAGAETIVGSLRELRRLLMNHD